MAKSKVHQKARAPKARAEQPVSEGIRRAAERAGIEERAVPPGHAVVEVAVLREIVEFLDDIPGFLAKTWGEQGGAS